MQGDGGSSTTECGGDGGCSVAKERVDFLWIDFRRSPAGPGLHELAEGRRFHRVRTHADIDEAIARHDPHCLCFDFDHPAESDLGALRATRQRHPSVPILMLTEHHTADLALWALRTRVWDYLVKPVSQADFDERIDELRDLLAPAADRLPPQPSSSPVPEKARPSNASARRSTRPAVELAQQHYDEPLCVTAAAKLCCMSNFHFCRSFKQDHGLTFHEFVIRCRLSQAERLLKTTDRPVKDIAYSVGFNDVAHFTRTFKRYLGVCPTELRRPKAVG
jgi:AraC-like DNA-binding protein